jgi:hypothetical protein
MNKSKLAVALFYILMTFSSSVIAQPKAIEYRFKGGERGFMSLLAKNIKFPESSRLNRSVGLSVSRISVSPSGAIETLSTINSIDQDIDMEVMRVLKISASQWLRSDSVKFSQAFYVQIGFIIFGNRPGYLVSSPVENSFFIDPVTIAATNPKNDESIMPSTDELLAVKFSVLIGCERYEESLPLIDELIRRNPFSKELYQFRITVCRAIFRYDLIEEDVQKLSDFAGGMSLNQLLNYK